MWHIPNFELTELGIELEIEFGIELEIDYKLLKIIIRHFKSLRVKETIQQGYFEMSTLLNITSQN